MERLICKNREAKKNGLLSIELPGYHDQTTSLYLKSGQSAKPFVNSSYGTGISNDNYAGCVFVLCLLSTNYTLRKGLPFEKAR